MMYIATPRGPVKSRCRRVRRRVSPSGWTSQPMSVRGRPREWACTPSAAG
ncbi:Uncharacterised protein [Mycobacteroides abscessus]|nr:Uncharacterised protein [Mycobacteroides abscessus]